jgi:N-acetylmuramoyl-L-alanine amidase/Zinc carboxypeptidase
LSGRGRAAVLAAALVGVATVASGGAGGGGGGPSIRALLTQGFHIGYPRLPAQNERVGGGRVVVLGHSVQGRAVQALRLGDGDSPRKALVVGVIHGDESAGLRVIRALRRRFGDLRGVDLWTVYTVNPDGLARGTRKNARGVDLNRNFSVGWSGGVARSSGYYPGPRPFSEPESRLVRRLLLRLRPAVTIWYHQPWAAVLAPCRGDARLERSYARISGLPLERCRGERLPGTATRWQERRLAGSSAFVVELPPGRLSAAAARRHARAAAAIAAHGAVASRRSLSQLKPQIVDWLIPYGARRKRQMAAYSERHYGTREWRLRRVEQIVEHLSVTSTAGAVYNTFAANAPDPEYGELPGVCSHYVIGSSGRIYRLVPVSIRCRHVVGLNHLSVGIEHVGYGERDVLSNRRQLRSSLRLTRWLRCRFRLGIGRVIGHAESLSSPFYRELVPSFRGRTHGDWRHRYMERYRHRLRRLGGC